MTTPLQTIRASVAFLLSDRGTVFAKIVTAKPLADYSESRFGQEPCEAERSKMNRALRKAVSWQRLKIRLAILTAAIVACFCL